MYNVLQNRAASRFCCASFSLELSLCLFLGDPSTVGSCAPRVVQPLRALGYSLQNTRHALRVNEGSSRNNVGITFESAC